MKTYTRPGPELRRVVVTGMGAVTPLGHSVDESWQKAVAGQSGIDTITLFDARDLGVQIAGEVKNFDPLHFIDKKEARKMDRFSQLAMAALQEALKQSDLQLQPDERERAGCVLGVGIGGFPFIEEHIKMMATKGYNRCSPFFIPKVLSNIITGHITTQLKIHGCNYAVTSACASGAHAIGEAASMIQRGLCEVMITGGTEASVSSASVSGFAAARALSTRNHEPAKASRPWDTARDGFVIAEAATILVLEDYERACKRGATVLAEVLGYGASSDAYHMTSPSPDGKGASLAMQRALHSAELEASAVDYINAHGTSTPVGDEIECQAIKNIFGSHAKKLCVSSTKSMTGHTLGAAGAMESMFTIQSLCEQRVPPTINLEQPSEGCDLDFITEGARSRALHYALNNSFGFGGTNASLVFAKI